VFSRQSLTPVDIPLAIDPGEVRAFQGFKPPLDAADLPARIEAARREAEALMQPRAAARRLAVAERAADRLLLAGGPALAIPRIGRLWGAVESVVAAVVTVGDALEAGVAARREAGDPAGATLLDSAGSAAAECLAEWLNDRVCELGVAAGLRVTNRISPGYAGWDARDQATLVRLGGAEAIGVSLRPDGSVTPAKTISLLIGLGRAARLDHYFVQCRRCWVAACPARRAPASATVVRAAPSAP
jgi:hypothetical protein